MADSSDPTGLVEMSVVGGTTIRSGVSHDDELCTFNGVAITVPVVVSSSWFWSAGSESESRSPILDVIAGTDRRLSMMDDHGRWRAENE